LLAAAARHVNDYTSDVGRPRLAELVPSVIGLTSEDPRVDARIALRCAAYALPVVAAPRQRVLAVSVLVGEHVLAELSGQPPTLGPQSRAALDQVPHAAGWARQLTGAVPTSVRTYRRHAAPTTVRYAVEGVAQACVRHPDEMLRELLQLAITECAAAVERPDHRAAVTVDEWAAACRLTGVGR
jgi:hypothetical protein